MCRNATDVESHNICNNIVGVVLLSFSPYTIIQLPVVIVGGLAGVRLWARVVSLLCQGFIMKLLSCWRRLDRTIAFESCRRKLELTETSELCWRSLELAETSELCWRKLELT